MYTDNFISFISTVINKLVIYNYNLITVFFFSIFTFIGLMYVYNAYNAYREDFNKDFEIYWSYYLSCIHIHKSLYRKANIKKLNNFNTFMVLNKKIYYKHYKATLNKRSFIRYL